MSDINVVRQGSGAPLVLVHGLGSSLGNWQPIMAELTREREVIAFDLPGFGESPPLTGDVTIETLTDAVEVFLQENDLVDADIVGSSMGARMVLEMARRGHAGTVVALDPGGFWTDTQVKIFGATVGPSVALVRGIQPLLPAMTSSAIGRTALLLQFSNAPWKLDRDLVLGELRSFKRATSLKAAFDALVHGHKQEGARAGSLKSKVVIGWGRNDRVTLPSEAQRATELFPDAQLHWFEHCGHFPHWDQPAETARLILDSTRKRKEQR
ncbi:alpha/beta fold hydrolase [Antrihabitans cavernicola]|uniref:Alpha/beta fold hydrolase n=1 Tax=Antrihabitans cavernicola TaxID=2495913 RepID=A0A5A7S3W2_9NOCA|nr:alpha/beta fold hydrolase [Spelaeibacter cavernicola]KAA0020079.1 alpha/beta fold hydrolase [Spelaeibacter cavernicola]